MTVSRRTMLGSLVGAGVGLGVAAVSGCSPSGTQPGAGSSNSSGTGARATLPTYQPYTGVKPVAPATDTGAAPFFTEFPSDPPQFVTEQPLSGGTVDILTFLNTTPTAMEQNSWWQAINERLGGTITMQGAPVADYVAKFQTVVAGNELPDLAVIIPGYIPAAGELLKAKFTDLSDQLSGDGVLAHPGLANIPSHSWTGCLTGGRIYTVPIPRFALYRAYIIRADLAEKLGVPTELKSGDDLISMMHELTDATSGTFATSTATGLLDMVNEMKGTPNGWAVDDAGAFTKDWEAASFAESLDVVRQLWQDKTIHPTSFQSGLDVQGLYNSGVTPLWPAASSWAGNAIKATAADPAARTVPITLPKWDGSGRAGRWLGNAAPYQVAIKRSSADRTAELLRVINWFASPWGTQENLLSRNGIEGKHFTVADNGGFTRTDLGTAEFPAGLQYAGSAAMVHYSSDADLSRLEYDNAVTALDAAVPLPTVGLESETDLSKGAGLTRDVTALIGDIIQGRKPLEAWDTGIKAWRAKGGDKIREEYQASYQASK